MYRVFLLSVLVVLAGSLFCSTSVFAQKPVAKHIEIQLKNFEISHIPFEFDSLLLEEKLQADYFIGKPVTEIKGCVYLNPGTELEKPNPKLPLALRYYNDIFKHAYISRFGIFFIDKIVNNDISKYYRPFYMKQYEVTNAEYREFVYWVRDSIARRLISEEFPEEFLFPRYDANGDELEINQWDLNWKKKFVYNDERFGPLLEQMYIPNNERYYRRKDFDTRKFNYVYFSPDNESLKKEKDSLPNKKIDVSRFIIKEVINVYPDTMVWIEQFPIHVFDYMTKLYYWHPAYDDFPVVGITFEQARAFCHWKTSQLNKALAKNKMEVVVDLPFEYEWEYATHHSNTDQKNEQVSFYSRIDQTMSANLKLIPWNDSYRRKFYDYKDTLSYDSTLILKRALLNNNIPLKYIADSTFEKHYVIEINGFTLNKKDSKRKNIFKIYPFLKLLIEENEIYSLNNNLSEWLNETRSDHRGDVAGQKRGAFFVLESGVSMYKEFYSEWKKDSASQVKYVNKLIRGENWFDNENTFYFPENPEGAKAKTFAPKDRSFATVGFRYVIRMKLK